MRLIAASLVLLVWFISPSTADQLATCTTVNIDGVSVPLCPPERLVTPNGQKVINGCGPGFAKLTERRFMDSHVYMFDVSRGESVTWTVNFQDSCNLHDVGYQGNYVASVGGRWVRPLVYDKILNQYVDYSVVSRAWIDEHFLEDMRAQCDQQIRQEAHNRQQAGRDWRGWDKAIKYCQANGGQGTAWGATSMYEFVRTWGHRLFDNEDAQRVNDRAQ